MKQAELNKLIDKTAKELAKEHSWKFSGGFIFKATDNLFFSLIINGVARARNLCQLFQYKWLDFDNLFWKIVKLEENSKQPLSFRAAGAWTAPMTTLVQEFETVEDWNSAILREKIEEVITAADRMVSFYSSEIKSLEDNLLQIERLAADLKGRRPKAHVDTSVEKVLTLILLNEFTQARRIIDEKQKTKDWGGFQVGDQSFFDLASEYLDHK